MKNIIKKFLMGVLALTCFNAVAVRKYTPGEAMRRATTGDFDASEKDQILADIPEEWKREHRRIVNEIRSGQRSRQAMAERRKKQMERKKKKGMTDEIDLSKKDPLLEEESESITEERKVEMPQEDLGGKEDVEEKGLGEEKDKLITAEKMQEAYQNISEEEKKPKEQQNVKKEEEGLTDSELKELIEGAKHNLKDRNGIIVHNNLKKEIKVGFYYFGQGLFSNPIYKIQDFKPTSISSSAYQTIPLPDTAKCMIVGFDEKDFLDKYQQSAYNELQKNGRIFFKIQDFAVKSKNPKVIEIGNKELEKEQNKQQNKNQDEDVKVTRLNENVTEFEFKDENIQPQDGTAVMEDMFKNVRLFINEQYNNNFNLNLLFAERFSVSQVGLQLKFYQEKYKPLILAFNTFMQDFVRVETINMNEDYLKIPKNLKSVIQEIKNFNLNTKILCTKLVEELTDWNNNRFAKIQKNGAQEASKTLSEVLQEWKNSIKQN